MFLKVDFDVAHVRRMGKGRSLLFSGCILIFGWEKIHFPLFCLIQYVHECACAYTMYVWVGEKWMHANELRVRGKEEKSVKSAMLNHVSQFNTDWRSLGAASFVLWFFFANNSDLMKLLCSSCNEYMIIIIILLY